MLKGRMTKRRSDATNAYDLLTDIAAYITEEPKRIWMPDWLIQGHDAIRDLFSTEGPACGTVGCIAGNAVTLSSGKSGRNGSISDLALDILGDDDDHLRNALEYELFLDVEVEARYGTKKYARIVAQRIRRFQKEHKVALLEVNVR